jgi:hypothetical protein
VTPSILLVGGDARQIRLLEKHFNMSVLSFRHLVQGTRNSAVVPSGVTHVLFWLKHCSHTLESSVKSQANSTAQMIRCLSSMDLLRSMIDICWDLGPAFFKYEDGVPTAVKKTRHRIDEIQGRSQS